MAVEGGSRLEIIRSDILVIGSGAAGLFFAIKAARFAGVTVITKKETAQSNTNYAQGGIASVVDGTDSFDLHIEDTIRAGIGLCDRRAVEIMVREGPARIDELIEMGVRFSIDMEKGTLDLGREGGHSKSRIVHCRDLTGRELEENLIRSCRLNGSINLVENQLAVDLVLDTRGRVAGCYVLDGNRHEIKVYLARSTVLASGGAGKIYLYTSNPDVATGDGIAMAYTAGADIANLEFVQFHPTCLYHPDAKSRLISEALRGEGAVLRNTEGREFMKDYDERRELAPRDVVARAIDMEMKKSGEKCVFLDITHKSSEWLKDRFPYVYGSCVEFGIDMATEPIPVVPAAHYMVGGVKAAMDGSTSLPGLFAIGEVACSFVHGANRLASNSLLEALVMAGRCASRLEKEAEGGVGLKDPDFSPPEAGDRKAMETVILDHDWDLARRVMWDYVGIVRSDERLGIASQRIRQIRDTVERIYSLYGASADMVELRNIALVSSLVIESARRRKESRGLHYNIDYPDTDPAWKRNTILNRRGR